MRRPYTHTPTDAFYAAETSLGIVLTAAILSTPLRSRSATALLLLAIWSALLAPLAPELFAAFQVTSRADLVVSLLRVSAGIATISFAMARPRWIALVALLGEAAFYFATDYVTALDLELSVAHVAWFSLLYGLHGTDLAQHLPKELPARPMRRRTAIAMVTIGFVAAAVVSVAILHRFSNSGDEWAYTFQADVFAHLRAYAPVPPCSAMFRNYWVFFYEGRAFSQYTPGWSLVMAPFQRLGVPWLAAPLFHGVLVLGVAHLARRVAASLPDTSPRLVTLAGWFAALGVMGFAALGNGGSRYPHTFIAAAFAWATEALCVLTDGTELSRFKRAAWGLLLGGAGAFMIVTRPADGGLLFLPVGLAGLAFLIRRRLRFVPALWALALFVLICGLSLVLLRVQVGEWFKTGYSLGERIHGQWVVFRLSLPRPSEFAVGIPLATGAYTWWPAAPALGAAGLFAARKGARRVTFILTTGVLAMSIFYVFVEFGRADNAGYGSRYHLPALVPMAAGTGVVMARLVAKALGSMGRKRPLFYGGAAGAAIVAMLVGLVRIAPMTYPLAYKETLERMAPLRAAERLARGIVAVRGGVFDPMDLTQNLPMFELPDVVFMLDGPADQIRCVMDNFPDRPLFLAEQHGSTAKIVKYTPSP